MKNSHYKCQQALQILLDLNFLREDSYLFSKIAFLQPDKKARWQLHHLLAKLQEQRSKIQSRLDVCLEEMQINQFWKTSLFQFTNRIYKHIKYFHQKLITFNNRIAQITDTNTFLQILRTLCIEKLSDSKNIKQYVNIVTNKLRERVHKQFLLLSTFGVNSKVVELARKDQNLKNNRFLVLLKEKESKMFFIFHSRALIKIQAQVQKITNKQTKHINRINLYSEILDLEQQNPYENGYIMQNGMSINLNYKEDGFCEFITTKYNRILKDLCSRNGYNQKFINQFKERHSQLFNKTKKAIKSTTFYDGFEKKKHPRKSERNSQLQMSSSIEMKNITNITFPSRQQGSIDRQITVDLPKKENSFKIQKVDSRKKSHTLRPLCQSKQNNKEVVHQRIIEMKLQEEPLQIAKILRIRKRKHRPLFKEENGWSLMVKEDKNKVSFLIH